MNLSVKRSTTRHNGVARRTGKPRVPGRVCSSAFGVRQIISGLDPEIVFLASSSGLGTARRCPRGRSEKKKGN